jgi:AcrR family transcriptional regulator
VPRRGLDAGTVLDAAVRLADDGLEQVTFTRLAEVLGVRAPSLYNHVDGRAALLRLITLRGLSELGEAVLAAAAGRSGEDALRATAHAYREYALAHPGSYQATVAAPAPGDEEVRAAGARLLERMRAIMRGWALGEDETIDAIRMLRSVLHGFVSLERAGAFGLRRDVDSSFERLLDTLVAGLGAVAVPATGR